MLEKLFSPMKIGNVEIPNRAIVPAMVMNLCTSEGHITDRYLKYIEEKAKGGFGLIITEDYEIIEHGKGYEFIPSLRDDSYIEENKKLTDAVHSHGSKIFCQIYHPGRQSGHYANGNAQPIAPSAIKDPVNMDMPREITKDEIHELVKCFGDAARRAKEAGFDGVEIHAAHGYLLSEFLSPFFNKRTDEYGGCFQNRMRFLDEIYSSVRKNVGDSFTVTTRVSANEYVPGGRSIAETLQLVKHMERLGFDAIHVTNSVYASHPRYFSIGTMFMSHAFNLDDAAAIKNLVDIPVILTNRINDPEMADMILETGKADFIGFGRASICDPHIINKAKEGRFDEIKPCIGCLQGCVANLFAGKAATCLVNPSVGREYENNLIPTTTVKKVMVIGGGPAGLVAAETAAKRGHKVSVYEKNAVLGGQWNAAAYPLAKGELATMTTSLKSSLDRLNVPVYMNVEVTESFIQQEKPDVIILATGAKPLMPNIKGIDSAIVSTAEDVLLGKKDTVLGPIVVCGGGEVGMETAVFAAQVNHQITVLEMQPDILADMMPVTKQAFMDVVNSSGVQIINNAKVIEITDNSVTYINSTNKEITIPAEQVISAFGYKSYNPLEEISQKYTDEVYVIGGAVKAGNALTATTEGYNVGIRI